MALQRKSAVTGAKQSESSIASYSPACYSAAEQCDMVVIVRNNREIRALGMVVRYDRDLVPQES